MAGVVSLNPSDMLGEPQSLNISNKKVMSKIHEKPLEWLVDNYMAPSSDPNAYLEIGSAPVVWAECVGKASKSHLFLHAFCLASADEALKELLDVRTDIIDQCTDSGNESVLSWLHNRPTFYLNGMAVEQRRVRLSTWSWEIKAQLADFAAHHGFTMRALFIAYSSKSLLSSNIELRGWRTTLSRQISSTWDAYVSGEVAALRALAASYIM